MAKRASIANQLSGQLQEHIELFYKPPDQGPQISWHTNPSPDYSKADATTIIVPIYTRGFTPGYVISPRWGLVGI